MTIETTRTRAQTLRADLAGICDVHLPGEPGYDVARSPWNLAADQRPAAVAEPADPYEVAAVVRAARGAGMRVAPQSTGHNAGPLAAQDLSDVVLLRTGRLDHVEVDPERRVARVGGGALVVDVVEAAATHGLAVLHGSAPDVGFAGFALGGGTFFYSRKLGLTTNSLLAVELVTADGALVRASETENRELFWAVRGGGGSFGVATAFEVQLFPIADVHAGMMIWDGSQARDVLRAWARWSVDAPDEVTTSLRVLNLPPLPELPDFLRGRCVVVLDGAVLDTDERAAQILAPLRRITPEVDTFARIPAAAMIRLHMDPEEPMPGVGDTTVLGELPDAAIDALLAASGPGSGSNLMAVELRQLGGALGRPAEGAGVLSHLEGQFLAFGMSLAATPEMAAVGLTDARRMVEALRPWANGKNYLNFAENTADVRSFFSDDSWAVLRAIRSSVDPDGLFVANHPVPRAGE